MNRKHELRCVERNESISDDDTDDTLPFELMKVIK